MDTERLKRLGIEVAGWGTTSGNAIVVLINAIIATPDTPASPDKRPIWHCAQCGMWHPMRQFECPVPPDHEPPDDLPTLKTPTPDEVVEALTNERNVCAKYQGRLAAAVRVLSRLVCEYMDDIQNDDEANGSAIACAVQKMTP